MITIEQQLLIGSGLPSATRLHQASKAIDCSLVAWAFNAALGLLLAPVATRRSKGHISQNHILLRGERRRLHCMRIGETKCVVGEMQGTLQLLRSLANEVNTRIGLVSADQSRAQPWRIVVRRLNLLSINNIGQSSARKCDLSALRPRRGSISLTLSIPNVDVSWNARQQAP